MWNRTCDPQLIYIYTPGKLPSMHIKCFEMLSNLVAIHGYRKAGKLMSNRLKKSQVFCFYSWTCDVLVWQEILMKPRFQCSTQFSWPCHNSLAWLWKISRLTLRGWRVFYIGSKNHNNYTCRNYIFCLNLPFENIWKLFYLYEVLENLTPKMRW